jgi:DNA polymerase-3 subunit gamma/tau
MPLAANPDPTAVSSDPRSYVVVARRYRPQSFSELIGQEHVAQALRNAITTNRVGHAYLFTGARGVGKTSAARIFAKALNCEKGPTPTPCNQCDACQSISAGEDVDVLEIDGASNRGIDEIRQLRQNAGIRPSRSRFKIYIIDEVHMLTREAFNALLKTLEEPPEHVKFIFCTTEPTKIPITILSRCQRYDFAGIVTGSIQERLRQIVAAEGVEAEPEALAVLARRAAGSMRDSQSLLEQLLAFSSGRITVADVHEMLGTAGEERLALLLGHLVDRQPAAALAELEAAVAAGVDPSQVIEQLFGCLRDAMVSVAGCPADTFLYTSPAGAAGVAEIGRRLGLETLLAAMQILDQTLYRMRYSTQGRILAELALVRISRLENLDELAAVIEQLRSGQAPAGATAVAARTAAGSASVAGSPAAAPPAAKKKYDEPPDGRDASRVAGGPDGREDPAPRTAGSVQPAGRSPKLELSPANAVEVWNQALLRLSGFIVDHARSFHSLSVPSANRLTVCFSADNAFARSTCQRPETAGRIEEALADVTGQPVRVEFVLSAEPAVAAAAQAVVPAHLKVLEAAKNPLVRLAADLFGAQPVRIDDPPEKI